MGWHTAQMVFVVALAGALGLAGFIGSYVIWTTMWSDRWAVRQPRTGNQSETPPLSNIVEVEVARTA